MRRKTYESDDVLETKIGEFIKYIYTKTKIKSAKYSQDMGAGISDLLRVRRMTFQCYVMNKTLKKAV